jgi:Zn-dependent protease
MEFDLIRSLYFLPGIIIGLTVHEFCHAYVAKKCGDTTAEEQGRISLNPLKHIDPLGFIFLLLVGFGWAKPVQFNERNLRNPKYDIMKIAIAGPLSNAVIAMILSVIFTILPSYESDNYQTLVNIILYAVYINWGLFVFNLIPLPPLDGSHLLLNQLRKFPDLYNHLYKYGSFIFVSLIFATILTKINFLPIWPVIQFLAEGFFSLTGLS